MNPRLFAAEEQPEWLSPVEVRPNSSEVFTYCVGVIYFSHLSEYIERTCGQKSQGCIRKISNTWVEFKTKSKFYFYEKSLDSALKY